MIRHIVFFKFKPEITQEQKNKLVSDLETLKQKIPLIKSLEVGFDIARTKNSFDLALNLAFDAWEDVENYGVHPDHINVVETIKKICQEHTKVDFEIN